MYDDGDSASAGVFMNGYNTMVFWWVPDGTTKYIQGLTKDRGEAPKREWVGSHLTLTTCTI